MKSTSAKYGTVAVTIHWLSAVLILVQLGSGFRTAATVDNAAKEAVLSLHAPLGILILVLMVLRLLWWMLADRKPDPIQGDPAWQVSSAKAVHVLFYIVTFGMVASGMGMMIASGASAILSGAVDAPLPDFTKILPRAPHGLGARLMLALFVLHVGAALYHHYVKKDGVMARMWYGKG
ncbi:cytochrome b [Shimia sediminis]|uniref:cytochrome b n=1 Tax=Shimia sediminis TaxID=2497945 RepID=UPI000F8F51C3|nr:cytochrome b [Shimia sediminis]